MIETKFGVLICCQTRLFTQCSHTEKVKKRLKNASNFCRYLSVIISSNKAVIDFR